MKNFFSLIFLLSSCMCLYGTDHKFILPKGLVDNIQEYIDPSIDPYTFFENHEKYTPTQKKRVVYHMLTLMKSFAKEEKINQKTVDKSLKNIFYKSFKMADSDIADELLSIMKQEDYYHYAESSFDLILKHYQSRQPWEYHHHQHHMSYLAYFTYWKRATAKKIDVFLKNYRLKRQEDLWMDFFASVAAPADGKIIAAVEKCLFRKDDYYGDQTNAAYLALAKIRKNIPLPEVNLEKNIKLLEKPEYGMRYFNTLRKKGKSISTTERSFLYRLILDQTLIHPIRRQAIETLGFSKISDVETIKVYIELGSRKKDSMSFVARRILWKNVSDDDPKAMSLIANTLITNKNDDLTRCLIQALHVFGEKTQDVDHLFEKIFHNFKQINRASIINLLDICRLLGPNLDKNMVTIIRDLSDKNSTLCKSFNPEFYNNIYFSSLAAILEIGPLDKADFLEKVKVYSQNYLSGRSRQQIFFLHACQKLPNGESLLPLIVKRKPWLYPFEAGIKSTNLSLFESVSDDEKGVSLLDEFSKCLSLHKKTIEAQNCVPLLKATLKRYSSNNGDFINKVVIQLKKSLLELESASQ